jgi:hypothetical protein
MDADADDIAGGDGLGNNLFQGLIDEDGVSDARRGCCS